MVEVVRQICKLYGLSILIKRRTKLLAEVSSKSTKVNRGIQDHSKSTVLKTKVTISLLLLNSQELVKEFHRHVHHLLKEGLLSNYEKLWKMEESAIW